MRDSNRSCSGSGHVGLAILVADRKRRDFRYWDDGCHRAFDRKVPIADIEIEPALLTEEDYDARLDRALIQTMTIAENGWLPAGLTGHDGVHRLLPNHALDLDSLRPRRVWRGATRTGTPPEVLVERIAEIATRTITAAAKNHRLTLALSAGRDSRAVLALTTSLGLKPETFTVAHAGAGLDVTVARELSEALGLRHTTLTPVMADVAEQELWMRRNGYVVGGINRLLHPTLHVGKELKNAAIRSGLELTPMLRTEILALSDSYGRYADAAAKAGEAQQRLDATRDEFRSSFSGFISDVVKGESAFNSLAGALGRIGDKLLNMATPDANQMGETNP